MPHDDHEKNRLAWNEMVEIHYKHPDYKLDEYLNGWNSLKAIEKEEVGDVTGKELLHLMCQFGMDTLSWARYGAKVTGVDISDNSIKYADKLKDMVGFPEAQFIRSDVLNLIGKIDKKFDIIFQSHGTHGWIGDLKKWAEVIKHYLKDGGFFYIVDDHPMATIWLYEEESYFNDQPIRAVNQPDYCDREHLISRELVEWNHKMSDFINTFIDLDMKIEFMHEFNKGYYAVEENWYRVGDYWYPPEGPPRYPLMFSMKVHKR